MPANRHDALRRDAFELEMLEGRILLSGEGLLAGGAAAGATAQIVVPQTTQPPSGAWQQGGLIQDFGAFTMQAAEAEPVANTWQGQTTTGAFNDAANWSLGHTPTATEKIVASGALTFTDATLTLATLKSDVALQFNGTVILAGTLKAPTVTIAAGGALLSDWGGAPTVDGDLVIAGAMGEENYGATYHVTGDLTVAAGGTLTAELLSEGQDHYTVDGQANLQGQIKLYEASLATGDIGQLYDILTSAGVTGTPTISDTGISAGVALSGVFAGSKLTAVVGSDAVGAQVFLWRGSVDNNLATAANWAGGTAPDWATLDANDLVVINPASGTLLTWSPNSPPASLSLGHLVLSGQWTLPNTTINGMKVRLNGGTLDVGTTNVTFGGLTGAGTVKGATITVGNLQASGGDLTIAGDLVVTGKLMAPAPAATGSVAATVRVTANAATSKTGTATINAGATFNAQRSQWDSRENGDYADVLVAAGGLINHEPTLLNYIGLNEASMVQPFIPRNEAAIGMVKMRYGSDHIYINRAGGDWLAAANWLDGTAPGPVNDGENFVMPAFPGATAAVLNAPGTTTAIEALYLGGSLQVTAGTLQAASLLDIGGTMTLAGAGAVVSGLEYSLVQVRSGGQLNVSAGAALNQTKGWLGIYGRALVDSNASLNLTSDAEYAGFTIYNGGELTIGTGATVSTALNVPLYFNAGSRLILAGGTFTTARILDLYGDLSGHGTFNAPYLRVYALIAPSGGGTLALNGEVTMLTTEPTVPTLRFAYAGGWTTLTVSGTLFRAGAVEVTAPTGVTVMTGGALVTAQHIYYEFATTTLPTGGGWQLNTDYFTNTLKVVVPTAAYSPNVTTGLNTAADRMSNWLNYFNFSWVDFAAQGLTEPQLPLLTSRLATLFDLPGSITLNLSPGTYYSANGVWALSDTLTANGYTVTGVAGGYGSIAATTGGDLLTVTRTFTLLDDVSVTDTTSSAITGALNLLRGLASDLNLSATINWLADLTFTLSFGLDSAGAFYLSGATGFLLTVTGTGGTYTGTAKLGGRNDQAVSGTYGASYAVRLGFADSTARYQDLMAINETLLAPSATGTAHFTLTADTGYTTFDYTADYTAAAGVGTRSTVITDAHALTGTFAMPGLTDANNNPATIALTGTYDAANTQWTLTGTGTDLRLAGIPLGAITLTYTISPTALTGALSGELTLAPLRTAGNVALTQTFTATISAEALTGTVTTTASTIELHEQSNVRAAVLTGVSVTTTLTANASTSSVATSFTATGATLWPDSTGATFTASDGADGDNWAATGTADGAADTATVTLDTLIINAAHRLELAALGVSLTIRRQQAQNYSVTLSATARLLPYTLPSSEGQPAAPPSLPVSLTLTSAGFTIADTTGSVTGLTAGGATLGATTLGLSGVGYARSNGAWSGAITAQAASATLWSGRGTFTSATAVKLLVTADLATVSQTFAADGLSFAFGDQLNLALPALSFTYNPRDGPATGFGTVNNVIATSPLLPDGVSATINGVTFDWDQLTLPAFSTTASGLFAFNPASGRIEFNNPVFASDGFTYTRQTDSGTGELRLTATNPVHSYPGSSVTVTGTSYARTIALTSATAGATEQFTLTAGGRSVAMARAVNATTWQATETVGVGDAAALQLAGSLNWTWSGQTIAATFTGTLTVQNQAQTLTNAALTVNSSDLALAATATVAWRGVSFTGDATASLAGTALTLASASSTASLGLFAQTRTATGASYTYRPDGTSTAAFTIALAGSASYTWTPALTISATSAETTYTFAASSFQLAGGVTLLALPQFTVTRSDALNGNTLATLNGVTLTDPAFGTTLTLNGVTLSRDAFTLPDAQLARGDYAVPGAPFTLKTPTYAHTGASVQLFPSVAPSAGNVWRGTFTLTAATATSGTTGLSATQVVLTTTAGVMPPLTTTLTLGGLTYVHAILGTVTLSDLTLTPGVTTLYDSATTQATLPGGGTSNLTRFAILGSGEVVMTPPAPTATFSATTVWIANFLKFDVTAGTAQARYAGDTDLDGVLDAGETWNYTQVVFRVEGALNFTALSGFAFNPLVGISGTTYNKDAANLVLGVAMIDGVATPWTTGAVTFGFANWQIGDSATLSYTGVLGAYANGVFTAGGTGSSATLTLGSAFANKGPFTGSAITATIDASARTITLKADFAIAALETPVFDTPALTMKFSQTATYTADAARALTVGKPTLGATLTGTFEYKPASVLTFTFNDVYFDFTAKGGARMLFAETGVVRLNAGASLNIVGTVTSFGLNSTGGVAVGDDFSVALGGDAMILDQMKWPTFLPVRIDALGVFWDNFNTKPADFQIVMSVTVDTFAVPLPIKFAGAIKGLVIDIGLLTQGKFAIVGLDAVELGVSGNIGGCEVTGGFLLGLVRIDTAGNIIDVLDRTTPVARSVLYGAIRGEIRIKNFGFGLYVGLSEYGLLSAYIRAGAPIIVDGGTMGFAISDVRGGIFFNSATPDITDARQLIAGVVPEITPVSQQTFELWRTGFYNQLKTQILAMNAPDPAWAMLSSPFRIEGGAQFYNVYATDNAFSVQADIIFDSQGKVTLDGTLELFKNPADNASLIGKFRLRAHFDISKLLRGDGIILANLEYLNEVSIFGKKLLNVAIWGSLKIDFGVTIDVLNPPASRFDSIAVEIVGGMGITGFGLTLADLQGKVRLEAVLGESKIRLEFAGTPHLIGVSDVVGEMPVFQGAVEFSWGGDGGVRLIGAFFGGASADLIKKTGGIAMAGIMTIRLNTSGEDVNFSFTLSGEASRQLVLPATTADIFIEGHLIFEYGGTRYFEMIGTFGVKLDTDGLALFGLGSITAKIPGDVTLFHVEASLLGRIAINAGQLELVLAARFTAPQSPLLSAAGVTLSGLFEFLLNTSGRAVTFEVPTEFPDLIGTKTITVSAGVPRLDGTEGSTSPWLLLRSDYALDPSRRMKFGDAFVLSGSAYLSISEEEGATLALSGRQEMVLLGQTILKFNTNGAFTINKDGIYGFAISTLDGPGKLPGATTAALTGDFLFEVNTTGALHTINTVTLEAGPYIRMHLVGALELTALGASVVISGEFGLYAGTNQLEMELDGLAYLGFTQSGTQPLKLMEATVKGRLSLTSAGLYGEAEVYRAIAPDQVSGLTLGMNADEVTSTARESLRFWVNTTNAAQTIAVTGHALAANEVVGLGYTGYIRLSPLGNSSGLQLDGDFALVLLQDGVRLQTSATAVLFGLRTTFTGALLLAVDGFAALFTLNLPQVDLGGLVTLGGSFVFQANTRDTAQTFTFGEGEAARSVTVASNSFLIEVRDANVNLLGGFVLTGNLIFGRTSEGRWFANIPQATPLTLSLLPGWVTTLYGTLAEDGSYSFAGAGSVTAGSNNLAGFTASATFSLSSATGDLNGSFSGSTWLLGVKTAVSGAFRRVNGEFEFTVSGLAATVGGFGLTGGAGALLVRADKSVRVALTSPLTVTLPVLGSASFGGYVDSRGSFELTATRSVTFAAGFVAPFRFVVSGSVALRVTLDGSEWSFGMTNTLDVEAFGHRETKTYTETYNGVGLNFYLPGNFNLGGLSVTGAAMLRVRADGMSFHIYDDNPLVANIPLLGRFELRGYANSPENFAFTSTANINGSDPAGFVGLSGRVTLDVASNGIGFTIADGSVRFLGSSAALSATGVYQATNNYLYFNVPNISFHAVGLGTLTGGFTYALQNGVSKMTVAANNPLRLSLFGTTAILTGEFRSDGGSNLHGSAWLDNGIGNLLRARGTLDISYIDRTAKARLAGEAVFNNVVIASLTADVATDFSSYFELTLPRSTFSLGGFTATGSFSYRADLGGTRHTLKIDPSSPVMVALAGLGSTGFSGTITAQNNGLAFDLTGWRSVTVGNTFLGVVMDMTLRLSNHGISGSGGVTAYILGTSRYVFVTFGIYTDRVEFSFGAGLNIGGIMTATVNLNFMARSFGDWQFSIASGNASVAGFSSISIGGTLGSGGINLSGRGSATVGARYIASFEGAISWSYTGSDLNVYVAGNVYVLNNYIGGRDGSVTANKDGFSLWFSQAFWPVSGLRVSGGFSVSVGSGGVYVTFSGSNSLFGAFGGSVSGYFDTRWGRRNWNLSGSAGYYIGNSTIGTSGTISFSVGPGYASASASGSAWIGYSFRYWQPDRWLWDFGHWADGWIGGSLGYNVGFDWNSRSLYFKIAGKSVRIQLGGSLGVYFSEVGGSTVFLDANRNGTRDADEPWTTTDANGNADFSAPFDPAATDLGALARFDANGDGVLGADEGQFVVNGGTGLGDSSAPAGDFVFTAGSPNGGTLFAGATVYFDANRNGRRDEGEPETQTDAKGFYVFAARPANGLGALAAFDTNGNGVIDPAEGTLYVEGGTQRAAAGDAVMLRYFVDANGNGSADAGEKFVDAAAAAGFDLTQLLRQAMQGLTAFDTNHDGQVSDSELQATKRDGQTLYLDANGNGRRDAGEVAADMPAVRGDLGIFAGLDANGNGALDPGEFEALQTLELAGTPLTAPQAIAFGTAGYVPVDNATRVFLDTNSNGRYDAGEAAVAPDATGFYTFVTPSAAETAARLGRLAPFDRNGNGKIDPDEGVFVVTGGTDNNNGLTNPIVALGLADQYGNGAGTALGTLSTLIVALTDLGLSPDEARTRVNLTFGLDGGADTVDPTDLFSGTGERDAELLRLSAQLNTLILGGAATLGDASSASSQRAVIDALARWILANVSSTPTSIPTTAAEATAPAAVADLTSSALIGAVLGGAGSSSSDAVNAATAVLAATNSAIQTTVAAGGNVTEDLARIKAVTIETTTTQLAGVAAGRTDAATVVNQLTGDALHNAINAVVLQPAVAPVLTDSEVATARTGATVIVPLSVTDLDTAQPSLTFTANLAPVADRVQTVTFTYEQGRWLAHVTLRADAPTGAFNLPVSVSDGSATATGAIKFASVLAGPTISTVSPVLVNAGEAAAPITIQLGNVTDLARLTVVSDNDLVLPASALLLTGVGATRTLTITPPAAVHGVVTVTLALNDGDAATTQSFKVTVTDGNQPPVLNPVSAGNVARGETVLVALNIADPDTGAGDLAFTATSTAHVQVLGFTLIDGHWFARLSVSENAPLGAAAVSVTANDGQFNSNAAAINLEITASPLGIAPLDPLSARAGRASSPFTFALTGASANAVLTVTSENPQLLANAGIVVSGEGATRQVVLTPLAGATGTVNLTFTLTDGSLRLTKTVAVEVLPVLVANTTSAEVVLDANAQPFALDLAALFNRSGGVTYAIAVEAGNDLVTVTRTGANALLTLARDRAGLAAVRVAATDGSDTVTYTLNVQVRPEVHGAVLEAGEALGVARFVVTATPSNAAFTVAYRTVDGTAMAGRDYEAASGVLHFAAGETRKIVEVPVLGNHRTGDQVVYLQLGGDDGSARLVAATIADADLALLQALRSASRPALQTSFSGFLPEPGTDALDAAEQNDEAAAATVVPTVQASAQSAASAATLAPLSVSSVPAGSLAAATDLAALETVRTIPTL